MLSISAARKPSKTPLASRSKVSFSSLPRRPRRIVVLCCVSSIATLLQVRRWRDETSCSRTLRDRAGFALRGSRRHIPRPARWGATRLASPEALLSAAAFHPRTQAVRRALNRQPSLLHPEGDVEAGLVPAGFSLWPRAVEPGR